MVKNENSIKEIVKIAKKNNIKAIGLMDFWEKVNQVWFDDKLTWEQKEAVHEWAWDVKDISEIEYVFGAIVNAYNKNAIAW